MMWQQLLDRFGDKKSVIKSKSAVSNPESSTTRLIHRCSTARSTRFGWRSSRVCGPTVWNKLPQDLQSTDTSEQFKRKLKGWLFEYAYGRCV